jgi:hypothetical protein
LMSVSLKTVPDIWETPNAISPTTAAAAIQTTAFLASFAARRRRCAFSAQHSLCRLPEPHGHGWFGFGFDGVLRLIPFVS